MTALSRAIEAYHAVMASPEFDKKPLEDALQELAAELRETDPWAAAIAEEALITLHIVASAGELQLIQGDLVHIQRRLGE